MESDFDGSIVADSLKDSLERFAGKILRKDSWKESQFQERSIICPYAPAIG